MKRVVVTGIGIVSSIGNNKDEVLASLLEGKSGADFSPEYKELGFRSHVYAPIRLVPEELVDRKFMRFMGDGAAYAYLAMQEAIADAELGLREFSNNRTGLIVGSGGASNKNMCLAIDTLRQKGARKVGPTMVPRIMASTNSACLSVAYQIKGVNYSISSACATSAHCIGNAYELIQAGKQDMIFAGGCEELDWTLSVLFDSMGALSSNFNDRPAVASRAYDLNRDGFVIAGGAGVVALEELDHAKARGARIYGEIAGYGATSDGDDMVAPSPTGEGAIRCMRMALENTGSIDYINTHGTSTPKGDLAEVVAIREVFNRRAPQFSSTKSLTGHSLGAAGVQEFIYSILMMMGNFIAASANVEHLDPDFLDEPVVLRRIDEARLDRVMSNSFGFGGTNATLVAQRYA